MKKIIAAAIAASLIATPALAVPYNSPGDRHRVEQSHRAGQAHAPAKRQEVRTVAKRDAYRSHWKKGDRFERRQAANYRVIDKPQRYRLNDAPRGYRWVGAGNDALLVGVSSGIVAAVFANALR